MVCYRPLRGWRSAEPNKDAAGRPNGKYTIVFSPRDRNCDVARFVDLPCGQCSGCRMERSRQWALRCVHELHCHDYGSFITLTFNDDALARRGHSSLDIRDWQLFMKRVRKRFGSGLKFMASGEYGDNFGRPHYHACLFGVKFDDQKFWKVTDAGMKLYTSQILERLWSDPSTGLPYGYSSVGALTYQSAGYVARYCMKKQVGPLCTNGVYAMSCADLDYRTGRITPRRAEFGVMSNDLGYAWFKQHYREWYRNDCCIHDGHEVSIPRYYDRKMEEKFPEFMETVKRERRSRAKVHAEDNTDRRLKVREQVMDARLSRLFHGSGVGQ